MAIISLLVNVAIGIVTIVAAVLLYLTWAFQYWKRRNVPCPKIKFPFGSIDNPLAPTTFIGTQFENLAKALKSQGQRFGGFYMFTRPILMPIDPELVKNILIRDFEYFTDRGMVYEDVDPLMGNLFFVDQPKWRPLRTKLSPAYTPLKMKTVCDTMLQCGRQMAEVLVHNCETSTPINIKDFATRYTVDNVGSCGYGIECNSFKYPDAEFKRYAESVFEDMPPMRGLAICFAFAFPDLARKLGLKVLPKKTTEFFLKIVKNVVEYRDAHKETRGDMMQLLMKIRDELKATNQETFTVTDIAAQAFGFFAAGFETSSMTMTFSLYELAMNLDIQEKARANVQEMVKKHGGKLCHEAIVDMKYLDQIVDETLRKHAPVTMMVRLCVKDYKIPDSDVVVEKGTYVLFPIQYFHHNPEYFPDPEKYDPERFTPENKEKRTPCTYMPFGDGPRNCIGLRFGLLQAKVGLASLLKDYSFSFNKETTIPIKLDPRHMGRMPLHPLLLDVKKVTN